MKYCDFCGAEIETVFISKGRRLCLYCFAEEFNVPIEALESLAEGLKDLQDVEIEFKEGNDEIRGYQDGERETDAD